MEEKNKGINREFFNNLLVLGYLIDSMDKLGLNPDSEETFGTAMLNTNLAIFRPIAFVQLLDKFLMEHEFAVDYNVEKKRVSSYFASVNIDASKILEFLDLKKYKEKTEIQIPNLDIKIKLLEAVAADNEKWYLKIYEELKKEMEKEPEVLAVEDNEDIINIQKEIDDTKTKLEKVKTDLGIDDPIVVKLEKRIKMLEHKKQRVKEELLKDFENSPVMLSEKKKLADMKERYEKLKTILGIDDPEVTALSKEIESQEKALELIRLERSVPGLINAVDQISKGEYRIVGSQEELKNPDAGKEEKENEKQDKPKRRKFTAKVKRKVSSEKSKQRKKRGLKWLGLKIREIYLKAKVKIKDTIEKIEDFFYPADDYHDEEEIVELKTDEKVPATEGNLSQDDEMFLATFDEILKNEEKGRHR